LSVRHGRRLDERRSGPTLCFVLNTKHGTPEPAASETTQQPPFPVEDRTTPEVRARQAEIHTMRLWTLSERARGNLPN
jgi:hypothetical protein